MRSGGGRGGGTPDRDLDSEITAFGEALAEHPFTPHRPGATAEAVADYEQALDAYEAASRALRRPDGAQDALRRLDDGRHALDRLEARLAGRPLPERLPLCFFDPRHGPSVTEVEWTPDGGVGRTVPVCGADAVRITEGARPVASGWGPPGAAAKNPPPHKRMPGEFPLYAMGAGLVLYAVVLGALGEAVWALLSVTAGGTIAGLAFVSGWGTYTAVTTLWRMARRGRTTRAPLLRHVGREHVYGVTDVSGRQHEYTRTVDNQFAEPLPFRTVWYVPKRNGDPSLHGPWTPLGLAVGALVGLPVFLGSTAATLYLVPGRLIIALMG
ncbi:hypothetical protein [Streptomyces sp. NPDC047928]|uniref:hypothetical protein n=1 Tax=unclassified Streptomyces TaxID=2593676 RepID=UPI00370FC689